MRAMADLDPGPHRSGEVANRLGLSIEQASPLRNGVINKGMVYSPEYGIVAFTVPMFDSFMRRSMPDWMPACCANTGPHAAAQKEGLKHP